MLENKNQRLPQLMDNQEKQLQLDIAQEMRKFIISKQEEKNKK